MTLLKYNHAAQRTKSDKHCRWRKRSWIEDWRWGINRRPRHLFAGLLGLLQNEADDKDDIERKIKLNWGSDMGVSVAILGFVWAHLFGGLFSSGLLLYCWHLVLGQGSRLWFVLAWDTLRTGLFDGAFIASITKIRQWTGISGHRPSGTQLRLFATTSQAWWWWLWWWWRWCNAAARWRRSPMSGWSHRSTPLVMAGEDEGYPLVVDAVLGPASARWQFLWQHLGPLTVWNGLTWLNSLGASGIRLGVLESDI